MISIEKTTKMNKAALAILNAGHLVTDINQGIPPSFLFSRGRSTYPIPRRALSSLRVT
jgi:hypothetical protein